MIKRIILILLINILFIDISISSVNRDKARRLFKILAGISPTKEDLNIVTNLFDQGKLKEAGKYITKKKSFYYTTVKNFATPWTNEERDVFGTLNDLTATVIGFVRDERPFNEILWKNIMYQVEGELLDNQTQIPHSRFNKLKVTNDHLYIRSIDKVVPMFLKSNNDHYKAIEKQNIDITDPRIFIAKKQNPSLYNIALDPKTDKVTAGILTTRGYGVFLSAGTNRAATAFAMENFLCKSMTQLNDVTIPDFRVRRDIDRAPGGKPTTFKSLCVGCHAGMDALSGAWAYYNYEDGVIKYTPNKVVKKMNHNVMTPEGFITQSDSWINLWSRGQNANIGWSSEITSGNGVKNWGKMLSKTKEFPKCMAKQVYESICYKEAKEEKVLKNINQLAANFVQNNYNMKNLFIETAIFCLGK